MHNIVHYQINTHFTDRFYRIIDNLSVKCFKLILMWRLSSVGRYFMKENIIIYISIIAMLRARSQGLYKKKQSCDVV